MGSDDESLDSETKALINIVNSLSKKPTLKMPLLLRVQRRQECLCRSYQKFLMGPLVIWRKEIAGEIDVDSINLDNPAGLIQDLLSGNMGGE